VRRAVADTIRDLRQELCADEVELVDRQHQRVGDVGLGGHDAPARMAQRGDRQQALRRRLLAQRTRGTMRTDGHIAGLQFLGQREAQRAGEERRQHRDLARRDTLSMHESGDLVTHPG
jgi:hypothetical protein